MVGNNLLYVGQTEAKALDIVQVAGIYRNGGFNQDPDELAGAIADALNGMVVNLGDEQVGELSIELPELLKNFFILQDIIKIAVNDKITLEFKFKNCSSLLALAATNKNKKILNVYFSLDF